MNWMLESNPSPVALTVAQDAASAGAVVGWVIALIIAALVGGVIILAVRKKMLEPEQAAVVGEGLFDTLRRMRDTGEITSIEYENARRRLIESATQKKEVGPKLTADQASILRAAGLDRDATAPRARGMHAPPGYDLTGEPLPARRSLPPGEHPNQEDPGAHA